MWGQHLKKRGDWWHYYRATPVEYRDVEEKSLISFSLKTQNYSAAKLRAAEASLSLEQKWAEAKQNGASLRSQNLSIRYSASIQVQEAAGFNPQCVDNLSDDDLLRRLRYLVLAQPSSEKQKAILGFNKSPALSLQDAFERFWAYIKDEWMQLSHDQRRTKRNIYLKSIRDFKGVVGELGLYEIDRPHCLAFRAWWLERVNMEKLKAGTGNRELNSLRRLISVNFDIDGFSGINPFARVKLKEEVELSRIPFSTQQIKKILEPCSLSFLHSDFQLLTELLVNTGMRPVEAIGLELNDVFLDCPVPYVHVRRNSTRGLKTDYSERQLPLLGVSLSAAKRLLNQNGWSKRLGKNMYATTVINRHLRAQCLVTGPNQSLYSLRHWFQDQLTKRDVIDRAQAQLMGHKFHRPIYEYGKDLKELAAIVALFAI